MPSNTNQHCSIVVVHVCSHHILPCSVQVASVVLDTIVKSFAAEQSERMRTCESTCDIIQLSLVHLARYTKEGEILVSLHINWRYCVSCVYVVIEWYAIHNVIVIECHAIHIVLAC
jgi:hypothetical protein